MCVGVEEGKEEGGKKGTTEFKFEGARERGKEERKGTYLVENNAPSP